MRGGPIPRTVPRGKEGTMAEKGVFKTEQADKMAEWLDNGTVAAWKVVEEAARVHSTTGSEDHSLYADYHLRGQVRGMARALVAMCPRKTSVDDWEAFIHGFAANNYENGRRIEQ